MNTRRQTRHTRSSVQTRTHQQQKPMDSIQQTTQQTNQVDQKVKQQTQQGKLPASQNDKDSLDLSENVKINKDEETNNNKAFDNLFSFLCQLKDNFPDEDEDDENLDEQDDKEETIQNNKYSDQQLSNEQVLSNQSQDVGEGSSCSNQQKNLDTPSENGVNGNVQQVQQQYGQDSKQHESGAIDAQAENVEEIQQDSAQQEFLVNMALQQTQTILNSLYQIQDDQQRQLVFSQIIREMGIDEESVKEQVDLRDSQVLTQLLFEFHYKELSQRQQQFQQVPAEQIDQQQQEQEQQQFAEQQATQQQQIKQNIDAEPNNQQQENDQNQYVIVCKDQNEQQLVQQLLYLLEQGEITQEQFIQYSQKIINNQGGEAENNQQQPTTEMLQADHDMQRLREGIYQVQQNQNNNNDTNKEHQQQQQQQNKQYQQEEDERVVNKQGEDAVMLPKLSQQASAMDMQAAYAEQFQNQQNQAQLAQLQAQAQVAAMVVQPDTGGNPLYDAVHGEQYENLYRQQQLQQQQAAMSSANALSQIQNPEQHQQEDPKQKQQLLLQQQETNSGNQQQQHAAMFGNNQSGVPHQLQHQQATTVPNSQQQQVLQQPQDHNNNSCGFLRAEHHIAIANYIKQELQNAELQIAQIKMMKMAQYNNSNMAN